MIDDIHYLSEAQQDLAEAVNAWEAMHEGFGRRLFAEIDNLVVSIGEYPHSYPRYRDDVRRALVAGLPFGVFYYATEHQLVIVAIADLRRDPDRIAEVVSKRR